MSFFDDDDEPAGPPPRRAEPLTAGPPDEQTLMVRRAVAGVTALVVLVLLIFGIKSCADNRRENALRDYNREVGALMRESDTQVSKPLFELLAGAKGSQPLDLETQVNQLHVTAASIASRARKLDTPGQMAVAQRQLETVLTLRRDAVGHIAPKLQTALGTTGASAAVTRIAAEDQAFLASDVLYSQRVIPLIKRSLDDGGVHGETIQTSTSLPNLDWLDPGYVGDQLGAAVATKKTGTPAPGTHGHGLISVSVGGTTLTPGAANRIPASADLAFTVKFQNQGENNESDVIVRVRISGSGTPITVREKVQQTTAGQESTVTVPLGSSPPIGTPVDVLVEVQKVPGEQKLDNNSQKYPAIFTR